MNAEIICVGTEIVLGDILNTHSQFLSRELAALGINVYYHTAVGDNDGRFTGILKTALERSDTVFLTGGLGPTTDDITKEVACQLLGIPCYYNETIGNGLKEWFARSGRTMTENNLKQAMIPEGAVIVENHWGTAPGLIITKGEKTVVLLPGPPRELRPMFEHGVKPYFQKRMGQPIVSHSLRVFGIGESALEAQIEDLVVSQDPTVALYAKDGEVLIRVTSKGDTTEQAEQKIQAMIRTLQERLGSRIYGVDVDSLHQVVVEELIRRGETIATAESCTGGKLAMQITQISGASQIFHMGEVTYANHIKHQQLGVSEETLQTVGAVSRETAVQMAKGLAQRSKADYNVSITGIAGPTGGTEEKPVGTVYIGVEHHGKVWCERYSLGRHRGEREYIRTLSCLNALNMVRLTMMDPKTEENYKD
ncbi:MAG: competence/damage-inducible protein A [Massiliimalia sp.]|jgi:nicotinamide-nucleotide amidase